MIDYRASIAGYRERVSRIALFDIFSQVDNKKKRDGVGNIIDYYGMMLLTLLFFFECMLTRTKKSGIHELAEFIKDATEQYFVLSDADYKDMAKRMVTILRPSGGRRNRREFMNFETGEMDFIEIGYLKVSGWDKDKNIQYYTLDEQGLELIFASKEYFSEFQISISQLILRKQLEKGEFISALRQIDEMRISVHNIRDKMITIKHEVQCNIISTDVYDRYKSLIEDINSRLQREHEEFEEITVFVHETKKHYEHDMNHSSKDLKAYQAIIRVDTELNEVHNLHSKLLDESIELKTKALEAARESMYYVGLSSFNFKQEVIGKVISEPMPFMETKLIAKPFLGMRKAKVWTPISLFAKQRIIKKDNALKLNEFLEFAKTINKAELEERKKVFKIVFSNIYKHIQANKSTKVSSLIVQMNPDLSKMKEVYEMLVLMHQLSPIDVDVVKAYGEHIFSDAMQLIKEENKVLKVVELGNDYIQIEGIQVSDMELSLVIKS